MVVVVCPARSVRRSLDAGRPESLPAKLGQERGEQMLDQGGEARAIVEGEVEVAPGGEDQRGPCRDERAVVFGAGQGLERGTERAEIIPQVPPGQRRDGPEGVQAEEDQPGCGGLAEPEIGDW